MNISQEILVLDFGDEKREFFKSDPSTDFAKGMNWEPPGVTLSKDPMLITKKKHFLFLFSIFFLFIYR